MNRRTLIVLLFSWVGVLSVQNLPEIREYACTRPSPRSSKSECMLKFGELSAINDNGCFLHFDAERQESIELCPLQCQSFNEAVVLKTSDSLICSPGVAVGVERRQSDWFMWRSGACKSSDVIFQIECSTRQAAREEEQLFQAPPDAHTVVEELPSMKLEVDNEIEEEMTSSIEDITTGTSSIEGLAAAISEPSTTIDSSSVTTAPGVAEVAEQEDDLPEKVDTLLGFLFPSYRRKLLSR